MKNSGASFYITVTLLTVVFGLPSLILADGNYYKEAYLAGGLSYLNAVAAYYLALRSIGRSYQSFIKSVFGGMAARILILAVTAIVLIKSGVVATIPFFLWLVLYYIMHQIIEIGMLNSHMSENKKISGEKAK